MAILTSSASGHKFKRVRGWRQPVKTSMRIKNKVKSLQKRRDRLNELKSHLEMIDSERMFLKNLSHSPEDPLIGFSKSQMFKVQGFFFSDNTSTSHRISHHSSNSANLQTVPK